MMRRLTGCLAPLALLALAASPAHASVELMVNPATGALSLRSTVGPSINILAYSVNSDLDLLTSTDETLGGTFQTLLDAPGEVTVWTPPGSSGPGPTVAIPLSGRGLLTNVTWTGYASQPLADLDFQYGTTTQPLTGNVKLLGDFDNTNSLQANDIDQLSAAVRGGTNPLLFDLTGDNLVTSSDLTEWTNSLFGTRGGDANLDRRVNLADFGVLRANFGQSNRGWAQGNFNTDTAVNLADFGILRANFGFIGSAPQLPAVVSASTAAVVDAGDASVAVGDIDLVIDVTTGQLSFDGNVSIAGFEISSGSGSLDSAAFVALSGLSSELLRTDSLISYGTFGSAVSVSGLVSLGNAFRLGGTPDLMFSWLTSDNQSIVGDVRYIPEPGAVAMLMLLGVAGMRRLL